MFSGRRKKIAIAAAILIVGTGIALLFRHEEAGTAARPPEKRSPNLPAPTSRAETPRTTTQEPKLAGRIEPLYGDGQSPTADVGSRQTPERTAATPATQTGPGPTATRFADEWAVPEMPSSFAASAGGSASRGDSPLKWQTVRRPTADASPAPAASAPIDRPASEGVGIAPRMADKRHTIVDGDTLAALAHRYLGSQVRQLEIYEYNRDVLASPELLPIGKELRIPPADFVPSAPTRDFESSPLVAVSPIVAHSPPPSSGRAIEPATSPPKPSQSATKTYVVQPHDTLALVARKLYGDISRQADLMSANRQQLRSAKDLRPGMTLVVPPAGRASAR